MIEFSSLLYRFSRKCLFMSTGEDINSSLYTMFFREVYKHLKLTNSMPYLWEWHPRFIQIILPVYTFFLALPSTFKTIYKVTFGIAISRIVIVITLTKIAIQL